MVEVCHDQLLLAVVDWWGLAVSASIGMSGAPRCVGQGQLGVSRTAYNHDLHHQQHLDLVLKVKIWVEETVLSTPQFNLKKFGVVPIFNRVYHNGFMTLIAPHEDNNRVGIYYYEFFQFKL